MALELLSSDHLEEDYIDMEVSSYSNNFFQKNPTRASFSSPPNNNPREFEFQMASTTRERDTTTSPADELFYKGKLLPLHLPPRLQMVEKLLETSNPNFSSYYSSSLSFDRCLEGGESNSLDELFGTPLMTTTAPTPTATSTPFESCNVSPSESFRISREICPEEYMREYSSVSLSNGEEISDNNKRSTTYYSENKKIKRSSLGSRFKASRAYLKSLFGISGCSDESSTAARKVADEGSAMKYAKADKKNNSFAQIRTSHKCQTPSPTKENTADGRHRRSFSLGLKRHPAKTTNKPSSPTSSSSSSSGSSSFSLRSNCDQTKYFKRCGSANHSESENSIQGAIAHCKKSQQVFSSGSSVSASRIGICEEQERQELCRG